QHREGRGAPLGCPHRTMGTTSQGGGDRRAAVVESAAMSTLKEILTRPGTRPQVIADCERLIEEEVDSKGLAGLPIKAAYKIVRAVKPGFIGEVIDHMLDDFCERLDPLYQTTVTRNEPVTAYFNAH